MTPKNKPTARRAEIIMQEADGELLIYDLNKNKAFCLNETTAFVFGLCDGVRDIDELGNELGKRFKTPTGDELAWLALNELRKCDLLENKDAIADSYLGMSRREVVKRIGLASAVALPLISSIIAPSAASAQSVTGLFGACDSVIGGSTGCPPSLMCAICFNSSGDSCPSFAYCCANGGGSGATPGSSFCSSSQSICNSTCCTGMGTLTSTACVVDGPPPGPGNICVCN